MLRRILNLFRAQEETPRRFVPSSDDLPELWPQSGGDPDLQLLDTARTETLTELCDDYWGSFTDRLSPQSMVRDSRVNRRALEILHERPGEAIAWARQRLTHDDYSAREDAAGLILHWAQTNHLGDQEAAVSSELVALAVTPPTTDCKEAQASSVALLALSVIGGDACMRAVRQVLTSREWDDDDNQWQCAEILAKLVGEPFMDSTSPVNEAKAWLNRNPESGD